MTDLHTTVWDETGGEGAPAVFVHNIFTWGSDEAYGFAAQRPLAAHHRLLLVDRRGYGHSPGTDRSDFDTDADDLVDLLARQDGGAHLVGHGNGGLAAMLAAGRRPGLVRSLTLIQPAAFSAAAGHPAVDAMLERVRNSPAVPESVMPEQYLRASTEGLGMTMPAPTPQRLRAVATSMRERPVWEATVPLEPLRSAPWPTLVICGIWQDAPELYRTYAGEPLIACAEAVAEAVGARLLRVPGYYPHTQHPATVNAALRELWR
ncbi:alpha/beta fold hydrolase [Streptomyces sp. TRM S81-3]|uniref:Alpha/beta fold hydrolase n=1 Tax=Streptomyces griseicoloratus TaxID=2752516 RepID=A0A926L6A1_9ACTN|nr:alpha/beta fold hydrolase [Streptomyces griseicoloratus]MBD0421849.1 alpha/beta fold hydrolase [Streptomyces griseicoloratus]